MSLFEVKNLKMYYHTMKGYIKAVDDISFELNRGDSLGIVGESGCGKSSVSHSILRTLPENGRIMGGNVFLGGVDLLGLPEDEMRKIRWKRISMIFQNALNALNPVFKIGDQLIEVLKVHDNLTEGEARKKVIEALDSVGIPQARMNNYPHEFSGGMRQRAIISMSLLCSPDIVIADEPTTALDVLVQDRVLEEIKNLQKELQNALIVISHDISVIFETCETVAIMYGGEIVECADSISIYDSPHHPYTIALTNCFPSVRGPRKKLVSLAGAPPNLLNPPPGCRFKPRCPLAEDICAKEKPPRVKIGDDHYAYCHFALDRRIEKVEFG